MKKLENRFKEKDIDTTFEDVLREEGWSVVAVRTKGKDEDDASIEWGDLK